MSRSPHAGRWVFATAILFFSRAFLFSTWVSRGPEVKGLLGINTVEMGLFTMLYQMMPNTRVRFGAVADFLYFHYDDWYWPAFNVADSGITIGVAVIVIDGLFRQPRSG